MSDGVIVAADRRFEWLIPWWWMNYSLHNTTEVTFINFGTLSQPVIEWCKERGSVLDFSTPAGLDTSSKTEVRGIWARKPFAMLESPYDRTLWLDLDCCIRGTISELFSFCDNEGGMAVVKEPKAYQEENIQKGLMLEGQVMYNSGVIVYKKGSPLLKLWTDEMLHHHDRYFGDQDALAHLLNTSGLSFTRLDPIYNWIPVERANPEAKVVHLVRYLKMFVDDQLELLKHKLFFHFP